MALACITGGRECDGCGRCFPEAHEYECPACGETLSEEDTVYVDGLGNVVGCEHCTKSRQAYEVFEKE